VFVARVSFTAAAPSGAAAASFLQPRTAWRQALRVDLVHTVQRSDADSAALSTW